VGFGGENWKKLIQDSSRMTDFQDDYDEF